jgi:tryptophan-rich hypothetical protein
LLDVKNPLHPKKLLHTKWTTVHPQHKEKHFLVVKVIQPDDQLLAIEQVVIEAVMTKRQNPLATSHQWIGVETGVGRLVIDA